MSAVEVPAGTVEVADTPTGAEAGFFFSLKADETGITELTFKKDPLGVFSVLFGLSDFVNGTFDQPFPTTGDFLRSLAESADKIQELHNGAAQGTGGNAEEVPAE